MGRRRYQNLNACLFILKIASKSVIGGPMGKLFKYISQHTPQLKEKYLCENTAIMF